MAGEAQVDEGTFFGFGFQLHVRFGSGAVRSRAGSVVAIPVLRFRFGSTDFLVKTLVATPGS